jgi:hypothetical protein
MAMVLVVRPALDGVSDGGELSPIPVAGTIIVIQ